MTTLGTGKYTYTAILDWAKLPPGETFEMSAQWLPIPRTESTPSNAKTPR